jgi:hypothetical protein
MPHNKLRLVFAEIGARSIPSAFTIPRVHNVFDEGGKLIDQANDKIFVKFIEEFEWDIEALKNQRAKGTPY